MGLEEFAYLRFANTMLEPVWNRNYIDSVQLTVAEEFGVEGRGSFYDPVGALRDVVQNHMMQLLAAAAMEPPGAADAETLKDAKYDVFRAMANADPKQCVRGQYRGYRSTEGVKARSSTETYIALRLELNNWRWGGVPFFLRTGKHLAVTQTEVRLIFKQPPRLQFISSRHRPPAPNQIVVRIDPHTGIKIALDAHRADRAAPSEIGFEMRFATQGGEDPTPYEVLLHAVLIGDATHFTREDSVEQTWRVVQPLLDSPPALRPYQKGSWGPTEANKLVERFGGWRSPWMPE
jgi:glucose-6-phosphate 1-dehydrogenase